jgi:putative ABC transport system ATP-binding protein
VTSAHIVIDSLNHHFGEGDLRRQILFDINTEIHPGEVILLTGPSGSGKTTLLTLVGALRTTQSGSLRVLGRELMGANENTLTEVRKRIGYIFQSHNLLEALTAQQNVQMALQLQPHLPQAQHMQLAKKTLSSVGLEDKLYAHPGELSGGQRQRVAIARALVGQPDMILADEPTASLDRHTGREIVELLQQLARQKSVTVVLVTHDNRILDIADRILTMEDGRLSSLMNTVTTDSQHMMRMLAQDIRKGYLVQRVGQMSQTEFSQMLFQITDETKRLLETVELIQGEAFESVHQEVISAFTAKAGDMLGAEQAVLYFLDSGAQQFWTYQRDGKGRLQEIRIPATSGIASAVVRAGKSINVADVLSAEGYDPIVDGKQSRTLLAAPVTDSNGTVFAVVTISNKRDAQAFNRADEKQLGEFTTPLGLILESWWRMGCSCRNGTAGFSQDGSCATSCP